MSIFSIEGAPLVIDNQTIGRGFSLQFDLPSQFDIINQATNFYSQNSARNFNFLNQSIIGTQNFLSHQVAPIMDASQTHLNIIAKQLPQYFQVTQDLAYKSLDYTQLINQQAMEAQRKMTLASINASKAAAQAAASSGGCFITTAVCEYLELPDNCKQLQILRGFRDSYMKSNDRYVKLVEYYYAIAPFICEVLKTHPQKETIFEECRGYIESAISAIYQGNNQQALVIYMELVEYAQHEATNYLLFGGE